MSRRPAAAPDEIRRVWLHAVRDMLLAFVLVPIVIGVWYAALVILIGVR